MAAHHNCIYLLLKSFAVIPIIGFICWIYEALRCDWNDKWIIYFREVVTEREKAVLLPKQQERNVLIKDNCCAMHHISHFRQLLKIICITSHFRQLLKIICIKPHTFDNCWRLYASNLTLSTRWLKMMNSPELQLLLGSSGSVVGPVGWSVSLVSLSTWCSSVFAQPFLGYPCWPKLIQLASKTYRS
jgi:hypothetical protein